MGYFRHRCVVVCTWNEEIHAKIFAWMESLLPEERKLIGVSPPMVNGYRSFICWPDGSKEGWAESDVGDKVAAGLKDFIDEDGDSMTCCDGFTVVFGGDDRPKKEFE
jgi:hypothetical protein